MPNAHRTFTRLILLSLMCVGALAFAMMFAAGVQAAETTGIVAPGSTWGPFADRGLYVAFGYAIAFAIMAITIKWCAEIIAPSFDTAVAIADRALAEPGSVTMPEAVLACGILLSTTLRIALLMLPAVVFAILL